MLGFLLFLRYYIFTVCREDIIYINYFTCEDINVFTVTGYINVAIAIFMKDIFILLYQQY